MHRVPVHWGEEVSVHRVEAVPAHRGEGAAAHRDVGVPCTGAVVWCSGAVAARSLSPHRRRVQPGGAPAARH